MIEALLAFSSRHRGPVLAFAFALGAAGWFAMHALKLDAIPDLSDPQVIVFTEWDGRSPTLVEDQVTYPVVTALLGAPRVADVRGQSMFGMSFVHVIFDEGTDPYWARSRVLEYLAGLEGQLPQGVVPRLGPDASGVGWVYQYVLRDTSNTLDSGALRDVHERTIRREVASVPGVAEVAVVGGGPVEYRVTASVDRLRERGLTLGDVADALDAANREGGGRTVALAEREHFVRVRGFIASADDLRGAVLRASETGRPLVVGDVADVELAPGPRRGATDWNGRGEVVSGIVVMRQRENALHVIRGVEERLDALRSALPPGVVIDVAYSRAPLVERTVETLVHALVEEMVVVAIVIAIFLLHARSTLLPIVTLPLAVLVAFIPMALLRVPATILSLGGIAIAIGATVDAEIVLLEAAHKRLEGAPPDLSDDARRALLRDAGREVTPAIFASLLLVAASFLPVFGLTGEAGRLFIPLAFTKTAVMLSAALLSVTVAPALRDVLVRGPIHAESSHPISRVVRAVYAPFVHVALSRPWTTLLLGVLAIASVVPLIPRLGSELMPALDEGDLLFMPSTLPGIAIDEAQRQLALQDAVLAETPEVLSVLGKVGRATTPTDPAPLAMAETVVRLRPRSEWRTRHTPRFWRSWPRPLRRALAPLFPEFRPMTRDELVEDLAQRLRRAGWSDAFTQPIRARIDMLATGLRTPLGVKVFGHDLASIERAGQELEHALRDVPGVRGVYFERASTGRYLDVLPRRDALARVGLRVADVEAAVSTAMGANIATTTLEGRLRRDVRLRVDDAHRTSVEGLAALPLTTASGVVALESVADVTLGDGPSMLRDENGALVGYVYLDLAEGDLGHHAAAIQQAIDEATQHGELHVPHGGRLELTGQIRAMRAMEERMRWLVPLALAIVAALLYAQFRNATEVAIVLLSVPFALVGSVWALYLLDFHLSTAVWVGVIALVGLAAQTGVVMIVYIDHAYDARLAAGRIESWADIVDAHAEGTIQRVRPKLMTIGTMLAGLVPLLWADGSGADVMRRIAAPMVGGLASSAFLTLELIPVVYTLWRFEQLVHRRLRDAHPTWARELERIARTAALSFATSAVALVAPAYLEPGPAHELAHSVAVVASLGGLGALLAYVAARRYLRTVAAPLFGPLHP